MDSAQRGRQRCRISQVSGCMPQERRAKERGKAGGERVACKCTGRSVDAGNLRVCRSAHTKQLLRLWEQACYHGGEDRRLSLLTDTAGSIGLLPDSIQGALVSPPASDVLPLSFARLCSCAGLALRTRARLSQASFLRHNLPSCAASAEPLLPTAGPD